MPTWPGNPAQHGGAHQQQQLRPTRLAAAKGESPKTAAGAALQPGLLVAFKKDERTELGLVLQPDGKKNYWIANEAGRRTSLPPKNVVLVLPGSGYTPDSLQQFSAAAAAADSSMLEIAWAVAAEEPAGTSYSLSQLSQLLFDSDAPLDHYATFNMLLADQIYFKSAYKGGVWSYQPRDAAAVEQAAAEAAAEAAEAAARQAFLQDWAAAAGAAAAQRPASTAAQQQQWLAGPHKDRVQALLDFASRPAGRSSKPSEAIARDTLALLKRRPEPEAAVVALQEVGLLRLHEPVPLLRLGHNAEGNFAPRLEQAAQALIASPPPDPDAASRVDLTHLAVYTIDDASTRDYDDGISVEQAGDGQLLLWVHVADPTRYLQRGDVLEAEACRRTRSLYFPFGSVPMFPHCLAEGAFSLGADASSSSSDDSSNSSSSSVCDALSVCVTLTADGALGQLVQLCPSRVRVTHRLTYDQVDADLGLGPGLCLYEDLQHAFEAARLRRAWRVSQGCIDIDLPEAKLEVDLDQLDASAPGITCTKLSQWESAARMLVAEMMILAGEAVGQLGAAASLPLPFRGQEAPQLPPEAVLSALPDGPVKGFALRKCMTRSVVSPQPVRHASLALDAYVQVTSPIRRYTDIIAHFNVKAHLRGEAPPFSASDISQLMAAAGEVSRDLGSAERDVDRYWAAEYMRQHWQRQQQQQLRRQRLQQQQEPVGLPAMVLGWVRPELNLAAVTLEELGLESVIKVDFHVEPGERLLLQVVEVDVPTGHYRLTVADRLDDKRSSVVITEELVGEGEEEGEEADEDAEEFAAGAAVQQWLAAGDDDDGSHEASSSNAEEAAAVGAAVQ